MADLFISLCDVSVELVWQCSLIQVIKSADLHPRETIKFWETCSERGDNNRHPSAKQSGLAFPWGIQ